MSTSDDLAAFVAVIERGSFAAAATALNLTPSAVSKTITRLENRLGTQLMTRTTRRLSLTEEGELFFRRSGDILASIEAAEAEVTARTKGYSGTIRVNSSTSFGRHKLTPLISLFLSEHPGIEIVFNATDRIVDPFEERADVLFRHGAMRDSTLIARKLFDTRRIICASPDYLERRGTPRSPADLVHHNCIVFSGVAALNHWPFQTPDGLNRMSVRGDLSSDNADTLLDLALAGHGIVRLVDLISGPPVADGRLVALLEDYHFDEPVPVSIVSPPGRSRVPRVRAFIDFVVANVGGRADQESP